jgi:hypothetical protein
LVTPPGRTREQGSPIDCDAGHEPRPTPATPRPLDVSGGRRGPALDVAGDRCSASKHVVKTVGEFLVRVANQEAERFSAFCQSPRQLPGRLGDPRRGRIRRAARDVHTATAQFDEKGQGPSVRRRCVDSPTVGCLARDAGPARGSPDESAGGRFAAYVHRFATKRQCQRSGVAGVTMKDRQRARWSPRERAGRSTSMPDDGLVAAG